MSNAGVPKHAHMVYLYEHLPLMAARPNLLTSKVSPSSTWRVIGSTTDTDDASDDFLEELNFLFSVKREIIMLKSLLIFSIQWGWEN